MWAVCVRARVKGQDSFPAPVCFYFLFHQPADSARILTSCWASTDGITHHACWAPLRNLRTLLLQGFQVRILNTCNLQSLLPRRSVLIRLDGIAFHTPGSTRKSMHNAICKHQMELDPWWLDWNAEMHTNISLIILLCRPAFK